MSLRKFWSSFEPTYHSPAVYSRSNPQIANLQLVRTYLYSLIRTCTVSFCNPFDGATKKLHWSLERQRRALTRQWITGPIMQNPTASFIFR